MERERKKKKNKTKSKHQMIYKSSSSEETINNFVSDFVSNSDKKLYRHDLDSSDKQFNVAKQEDMLSMNQQQKAKTHTEHDEKIRIYKKFSQEHQKDKVIAEKNENTAKLQRDGWMNEAPTFKTFSREYSEKKPKDNQTFIEAYDPSKSVRELNPYWKTNGIGLPYFQKPHFHDSDEEKIEKKMTSHTSNRYHQSTTKSWRKSNLDEKKETILSNEYRKRSHTHEHTGNQKINVRDEQKNERNAVNLKEKQMNSLSAKLMKAEMMADTFLINKLKAEIANVSETRDPLMEHFNRVSGSSGNCSLQNSKQIKDEKGKVALQKQDDKLSSRITNKNSKHAKSFNRSAFSSVSPSKTPPNFTTYSKIMNDREEHVLLTESDRQGNYRPLQQTSKIKMNESDLYGGQKSSRFNKKRIETYVDNKRVIYFQDDNKYNLKEMFENEKYSNATNLNLEFANIASKQKSVKNDLDDIFEDEICKSKSQEMKDNKYLQRAIENQQRFERILEKCDKCVHSKKFNQEASIKMGTHSYISLPNYEGLTSGHCIIATVQHVPCSTQLDEDVWAEINEIRKTLVKIFNAQKKDIIFYEIVNKLSCNPHLIIHCIPIPSSKGEMAPFYFKKAIEEAEHEWCVNKQLISLRNSKTIRNAIPKNLPYFWVNFGMDTGFAHVIEDEDRFPNYFADEIIGGILQLNPTKWRQPEKQKHTRDKVERFKQFWTQI